MSEQRRAVGSVERWGASVDDEASDEAIQGALAALRELLGMDVAFIAALSDHRQLLYALEGDGEPFGLRLGAGLRELDLKDPAIGAYAAVPLGFPDGSQGSLCCLSRRADPGHAERDLSSMRALAQLIESHLERGAEQRGEVGNGDSAAIRASVALRTAVAELNASRAETIMRLSRALDYRDDDSGQHTDRVGRNAALLAREAGLSGEAYENLLMAAPLHDAGKVAIPDAVLLKPGRLDGSELRTMQTHTEVGYELLRNSGSSVVETAATIALSHHERIDGRGYPRGLRGAAIPLEGRIVAIADAYDALTHDRVYRSAFSADQAIETMLGEEGHFDPELLGVFIGRVVGEHR